MRHCLVLASLLLIATLHSGCVVFSDGREPMETRWIVLAPAAEKRPPLVVFLPGRFDSASKFLEAQFTKELTGRADAVLVEAHLGYYRRGTFSERLTQDVIEPARARGYREIWVVGVSLGGIGALLYEEEHPGTWRGVVLLAPFLGDKDGPFQAIDAAGGLEAWNPPVPAHADFQSRLWRWIKAQDFTSFPVYLGAGDKDRMSAYQARLSARLPVEHVLIIPGGHDWKTWTALWREISPRLPLENPTLVLPPTSS